MKPTRLALFGLMLIIFSACLYLFGVGISIPRRLFSDSQLLLHINSAIVWYSGIPLVSGAILFFIDLLFTVRSRRENKFINCKPIESDMITVVLTAYNDELAIADSVRDFTSHPKVKRVIVISNNSTDNTLEEATKAGAKAYNEDLQGYGACVQRALSEGAKHEDTDFVLLCEGDMTFRAHDIEKFLAYIPHVDIVLGTRIVEQLQSANTQLTTFMHYGNFFVGKLLEAKYLGAVSLTDVGTTYKFCRRNILTEFLPKLDPSVNLEYNPYFIDKALNNGISMVECPITFYPRVGVSKGGNRNNYVAMKLGLSMIIGILLDWKFSGKESNKSLADRFSIFSLIEKKGTNNL